MSNPSARSAIRLRGVRHNNLKNFDLDLPLNQLVVVTGLSGSGKSSLAFDTLFAEGQRRYIETFSPYARQFLDRMDKPQVDSIEGIPPAIAIEQRNAVRTTRSTVGTMTEICDYMKVLWQHLARLYCRQCGRLVRKDSPQDIFARIASGSSHSESPLQPVPGPGRLKTELPTKAPAAGPEVLITFDLPIAEKLSLEESLVLISKQGYQRLLVQGRVVRLEEIAADPSRFASSTCLTVVQDRLKVSPASRARFIEACEQAYHFGKGKLSVQTLLADSTVQPANASTQRFSNRLHCAECDLEYRESSPALFSFNHPVGACPACKGFGRIISIDYDLAIPDRSKTLAEGVVKPWLTGTGAESQRDLLRTCRHFEIPTDIPFEKLPAKWQQFVIEGEPAYGTDEEHEWPRAWYGVKGYFRWLETKAYKMHVRVLLSRYRAYTPCPECKGSRFQPDALLYKLTIPESQSGKSNGSPGSLLIASRKSEITLADFYQLPVRDSKALLDALARDQRRKEHVKSNDPVFLALEEVRSRLGFLNDVGLGYLTLDRPTRSLSGGETERVNLTTCLGTRLVNTLFVLDEPSVGLHPSDTERLVRILQALRDAGNTVVVVEHESNVMRAADQIIDLGPGHGATGGNVVFQGSFPDILKSTESLTGAYLSGRKQIELPQRRPAECGLPGRSTSKGREMRMNAVTPDVLNDSPVPLNSSARRACLKLSAVSRHNLKEVTLEIPLGRFVCVTGVSGSGKTTLVREILLPALDACFKSRIAELKLAVAKASERFDEGVAENETEESASLPAGTSARLEGAGHLGRVVLVDQSILGKTPRSNPAVYIGAFDDLREVFAQSEAARQRGLNASSFSFNSAQGQCERCRGAGFEKIEMQFLSDVFIRCPDCNGRRYRSHILEVKIRSSRPEEVPSKRSKKSQSLLTSAATEQAWSIADMLEATADEAIEFLAGFAQSRPAQRAAETLRLLQEVGLGYLRLGQPINTLSGGESQRLKLVRHLAEAAVSSRESKVESRESKAESRRSPRPSTIDSRPTLFLFDEPTTGLHFEDVRVLLKVFQRLVDAGHSVVVIEHNLDVIKSADWIIDLGPGAGDEGGRIVAEGTPEQVALCEESRTATFLRDILQLQLRPQRDASRSTNASPRSKERRKQESTKQNASRS